MSGVEKEEQLLKHLIEARHVKQGNKWRAVGELEKVVVLVDKESAPAVMEMGALLLSVGELGNAIKAFKAALFMPGLRFEERLRVVEDLEVAQDSIKRLSGVENARVALRNLSHTTNVMHSNALLNCLVLYQSIKTTPQQDWATQHHQFQNKLFDAQTKTADDDDRLHLLELECAKTDVDYLCVLQLFNTFLRSDCKELLDEAQTLVCNIPADASTRDMYARCVQLLKALLQQRADNTTQDLQLVYLSDVQAAVVLAPCALLKLDDDNVPELWLLVSGTYVRFYYEWLWWYFDAIDALRNAKSALEHPPDYVRKLTLPSGVAVIWHPKKKYGLMATQDFDEGALQLPYGGTLVEAAPENPSYTVQVCNCGPLVKDAGRSPMFLNADPKQNCAMGPAALINHAGDEPDFYAEEDKECANGVAANMELVLTHDFPKQKRKRRAGTDRDSACYEEIALKRGFTLDGLCKSRKLSREQFIMLNPHLTMSYLRSRPNNQTIYDNMANHNLDLSKCNFNLPIVEMTVPTKVLLPLPCRCGEGCGSPLVFAVNPRPLKAGDELYLNYFGTTAPNKKAKVDSHHT